MIENNEIHEDPSLLVGRYFDIQQTITGGGKFPYLYRFVGQLTIPKKHIAH